jgi:hypothetical protein
MVFVWQALMAALLPVAIRDVPASIDPFVAHLARDRTRCRERKAALFERQCRSRA